LSYTAASESILIELVRVEDLSSLEHEIHRPAELGGEHRQGLALAVVSLQPLVQGLGGGLPRRNVVASSPSLLALGVLLGAPL
jgi:hypothetical protein